MVDECQREAVSDEAKVVVAKEGGDDERVGEELLNALVSVR